MEHARDAPPPVPHSAGGEGPAAVATGVRAAAPAHHRSGFLAAALPRRAVVYTALLAFAVVMNALYAQHVLVGARSMRTRLGSLLEPAYARGNSIGARPAGKQRLGKRGKVGSGDDDSAASPHVVDDTAPRDASHATLDGGTATHETALDLGTDLPASGGGGDGNADYSSHGDGGTGPVATRRALEEGGSGSGGAPVADAPAPPAEPNAAVSAPDAAVAAPDAPVTDAAGAAPAPPQTDAAAEPAPDAPPAEEEVATPTPAIDGRTAPTVAQSEAEAAAYEGAPPSLSAAGGTQQGGKRAARNPWLTRQVCHELQDLSELCVYDGPVCIDAVNWKLHVAVPDFPPDSNLTGSDGRETALDERFMTPKEDGIGLGVQGTYNLPAAAYADPVGYAQRQRVNVLPVRGRLWGPEMRWTGVSEVPWRALAAATSAEDIASGRVPGLSPAFAQGAAESVGYTPPANWMVRKFNQGRYVYDEGTNTGGAVPDRVTWMHGAAYFLEQSSSWMDHPFHFASSAFALWAAKRENATESIVGFPHVEQEGSAQMGDRVFRLRHGGLGGVAPGSSLPPMDNVVLLGEYLNGRVMNLSQLPYRWQAGVWPLLVQDHTRTLTNGEMKGPMGLNASHWMCFNQGVQSSVKPRLFSGSRDAFAFRLAAYALANVTQIANPTYPPRKITIIQRHPRGFYEVERLVALVNATGLEYEIFEELGAFSFEKQVSILATTGILIATHGGALTNVMFMPVRSVVIEVFPWIYQPVIFKDIAEAAGVIRYRLRSRLMPDIENQTGWVNETWEDGSVHRYSPNHKGWEMLLDPNEHFFETCHNEKLRPSSFDVNALGPCSIVKNTDPTIDWHVFEYLLETALDDIGCRDSMCRRVDKDNAPLDEYDDMRKINPGGKRVGERLESWLEDFWWPHGTPEQQEAAEQTRLEAAWNASAAAQAAEEAAAGAAERDGGGGAGGRAEDAAVEPELAEAAVAVEGDGATEQAAGEAPAGAVEGGKAPITGSGGGGLAERTLLSTEPEDMSAIPLAEDLFKPESLTEEQRQTIADLMGGNAEPPTWQ